MDQFVKALKSLTEECDRSEQDMHLCETHKGYMPSDGPENMCSFLAVNEAWRAWLIHPTVARASALLAAAALYITYEIPPEEDEV